MTNAEIENQYLPVAGVDEMTRVVESLKRAKLKMQDSDLTDEDKRNISKYPLLPGNQLEVHRQGIIDICTILEVPEVEDRYWIIKVRLSSGSITNYHLYGLGILHTGRDQSENRTRVRIPEVDNPSQ